MKNAKELALLAARALSDKKGKEIQVLEIGELTTLADYFVIATGSSNTQINALVDNVEKVLLEEAEKKPLLGICLGMQLLFDRSFEYGEHPGLGLVPGQVVDLRRDLTDKTLKVPHMGWNSLQILKDDPLFRHVRDGEYVYYVHSFYARDCAAGTLAASRYGNVDVTGVVRRGNVYGTQFHPEKSGDTGLRLLRAFAEL